jgi:hypothetical protein
MQKSKMWNPLKAGFIPRGAKSATRTADKGFRRREHEGVLVMSLVRLAQ